MTLPTTTKKTGTTSNWLTAAQKPHAALLNALELPARYAQATLDDVPHDAFVKVAKKYGEQFWDVAPKGIAPFLTGSAGEYKTVTAAAIARGVHDNLWLNVGWCNCAAEFVRFDREAFNNETQKRIEFLKNVPFLVMDDFSQVPPGTRMSNTMVEVGSIRYDNMLPTLWTGNLVLSKTDHTKLIDHVGACLARRMLDTSAGFRAQVKR